MSDVWSSRLIGGRDPFRERATGGKEEGSEFGLPVVGGV